MIETRPPAGTNVAQRGAVCVPRGWSGDLPGWLQDERDTNPRAAEQFQKVVEAEAVDLAPHEIANAGLRDAQ